MLEDTIALARLGQDAALRIPNGHIHDADLWIWSNGFASASVSLWERLNNVEKQKGDQLLTEAINAWQTEHRGEFDRRIKKMRNAMAHQGTQLTTIPIVEWEESIDHDTVFPRAGNTFAEIVMSDGSTRHLSLKDWANEHFLWWQRQLADIERNYRSKRRTHGT